MKLETLILWVSNLNRDKNGGDNYLWHGMIVLHVMIVY